jgi:catechol 2,3-dioxygenase
VKVEQLGHVVLKVRDLARAEAFYNGVLGLPIVARAEKRMTFFSLGDHHDFAIVAVDPNAPDAVAKAPGLFHVAFKVGTSLDELRAVKEELESQDVAIDFAMDHTVSQSLYLRDPDGNGLELYVDVSDVWRTDPQTVASSAPLAI